MGFDAILLWFCSMAGTIVPETDNRTLPASIAVGGHSERPGGMSRRTRKVTTAGLVNGARRADRGAGLFAVSESGALAYLGGGVFPQDRWSLVWVDRTGKTEPLNSPRGSYVAPRLSPDGKRVVFNTTTGDWDLSIYDVARGCR